MSAPEHVPTGLVLGAAAMMVAALALAAGARPELAREVQAEQSAPPLASRLLVFADAPNGDVVAFDSHGVEVARFTSVEAGFARGVLRGMFRIRKIDGLPREAPLELAISAKERLTLRDPLSGRVVDLQSFGDGNALVFAQLLRGEAGKQATR